MTISSEDGSTERLTTSSGRKCDECGAYVTRDYHRVFSERDGTLRGCISCAGQGAPRGGNR